MTKPAAWGLPREDGSIIDVITPAQHSQLEGGYTIPLYRHPPVHNVKPVAWTDENFTELAIDEDIAKEIGATVPLYTSSPKREWQGLTDEEIDEGQRQSWVDKQAFESAVWWAEAKLKEKNT